MTCKNYDLPHKITNVAGLWTLPFESMTGNVLKWINKKINSGLVFICVVNTKSTKHKPIPATEFGKQL